MSMQSVRDKIEINQIRSNGQEKVIILDQQEDRYHSFSYLIKRVGVTPYWNNSAHVELHWPIICG